MAIFQGPEFSDQTGVSSGTVLDQAHLNSLVLAQVSYLQTGTVPTTATAANPPVVTQPTITYVINSGTAASYHPAVAGVTIGGSLVLPTSSGAQDVYCDVDDTESFTLTAGVPGFTPPPAAVNALRLWVARTDTGNVGVVGFTDLSNKSPLGATSFMAQDGSNALAVTFPSTLAVAGMTNLNGGANVNAGILRYTNQPATTLTKGAGLSSASAVAQINGGSQNGRIRAQILTSNSNPALSVVKVALTTDGLTPDGVVVGCSGGVVAWTDVPAFAAGVWSFNIFTLTALSTVTSIYDFTYEVLYQ